jgi:polynucleotide 5'-kinase involved in rRNA processing
VKWGHQDQIVEPDTGYVDATYCDAVCESQQCIPVGARRTLAMIGLIWPEQLKLPADTYIPRSWHLTLSRLPRGTIMILGGSDSGKTTFAKYLFSQLHADGRSLGYLDCDVGQSTLGLPTTLNLAVTPFRAEGPKFFTYFVGNISPRAHMLPLVIGAHRLQHEAQKLEVATIIADTTGLVDAATGGVALKHSLIELLEPAALVGLRQETEIDPILRPWHHDQRLQVFELSTPSQVTAKSREARIQYRHQCWLRYFDQADYVNFSLRCHPRIAVFGLERARCGQLLAFQDRDGFALGLGIIQAYDRRAQEFVVRTPAADLSDVCSFRIGAVRFHVGEPIREWLHREDASLAQ